MKEIPQLKISLPGWPAQRILNESVLSWNLRHPESLMDVNTSSWDKLRTVTLAFLRHRMTDYDQRLRDLCEYDPDARNGLARAIHDVAWKIYPWFQNDPRPFPLVESDHRYLNRHAEETSKMQNLIEHLRSAIKDLSRQPFGNKAQIRELKKMLTEALTKKETSWGILTEPTHTERSQMTPFGLAGECRAIMMNNRTNAYCFHRLQPPSPNIYKFLFFCCPRCKARVIESKRPLDIGQGKRAIIQSCFCIYRIISAPPNGGRLVPGTAESWEYLITHGLEENFE